MSEKENQVTQPEENTEVKDAQETEEQKEETKKDDGNERTFTRSEMASILSAQKEEWEKEFQEKLEEAKTEGERLAKLSKDEREQEEKRKQEERLAKREQELNERELRLETQSLLAEEGLPADFLGIVMADSAKGIRENITNLKKTFDEAVEQRVDERLTQKSPRKGATGSALTKEEILKEKDTAKRLQLIQENRQLFN